MHKRQKVSANAYHDSVPLGDGYDLVYAREGKLRKVGRDRMTHIQDRVPQHATDSWSTTDTWKPPDNDEYALDPDGAWFDELVEGDVMQTASSNLKKKPKKERSRVSRRPHVVWKDLYRQIYLDEVTRWSGRGDFRTAQSCADCASRSTIPPGSAEYRCEECILPDLTCGSCCVKRHRFHPFHRIKKWTGSTFTHVALKDLGLHIQLNHTSMRCENPIPCHTNMRILHTNGIHHVAILYCGCTRAIPQHLQLLRRRFYPASQITVRTCATFELLKHLHMLSLATKASTYDFYRALEKSTNNTGMDIPKSRYRALFRMVLQWRHLKLLKRAGRSLDPTGVEGTITGELALQCPSCPYPTINLPDNWADAPPSMKFLYRVIICMDANFRLKNQVVSNYSQDPGLGTGLAYMVLRAPYEAYVLSRADDKDISTCVGFQALAKANTKFSFGLRYTGLGLTVCGRSEMIMPQGVGNLHKGERYANMDYIFGSALQFVCVALVLISYNIACQWYINLFKRINLHWPPTIKPNDGTFLEPAIPKLHEPMHQTLNHQMYSLNFIPGAGLSDCECPERVWAPHNPLANSTKTQGPGSRQDVLDDHFSFWNWLKYVGLGKTLARRYKQAVAERNMQTEGHRGLTASLDKKIAAKWEKLCVEWEEDPFPKKKFNPYYSETKELSEAQVKKALAEDEGEELRAGKIALHATSASAFIVMGLELEGMQRRLRRMSKESPTADTKAGSLAELRNSYRTRLRAWERLVPIYMPGLLQYQEENPDITCGSSDASVNAEDASVWLPSGIPAGPRASACVAGLADKELRLRMAQCKDALDGIRRILKIKTRMIDFKNKNLRGQRDGTRSRTIIDRVHFRARSAADKYRAARAAVLALKGPGDWETSLRILEDKDIRGYQDPNRLRVRKGRAGIWDDDQVRAGMHLEEATTVEFDLYVEERTDQDNTGETRRTLSWIWLMQDSSTPEDDGDDILQVEWAKSRARAMRAKEEVLLLKEEMRRILAYLDWRSKWWLTRKDARKDTTKDMAEALSSYAIQQSSLQTSLAASFQKLWKTPLEDVQPLDDGTEEDGDDDDEEEEEGEGEEEVNDEDMAVNDALDNRSGSI